MERPIPYRPQPVEPKGSADEDSPRTKYCLLCPDPPAPPAVLCGSCKIALCLECFQRHVAMQRFAAHKSVPYEDVSWCPMHIKRQILFCDDCREKCCLICANFGLHKGHSVLDREIAAQRTIAKEAKDTEELRQKVYAGLLATVEAVQSQLQELNEFESEGCRTIREEANRRRKETSGMFAKSKEELEKLYGLNEGKDVREMEEIQVKLKEVEALLKDERIQPPDFALHLTHPLPPSSVKPPSTPPLNTSDTPSPIPVPADEEISIKPTHFKQSSENFTQIDPHFQFSDDESSILKEDPGLDDPPDEHDRGLQVEPEYIYTLCNESDKVIRLDMRSEVWDVKTADRTWPKFCNFTQIDGDELIVTGGGHIPSKRTYILDLNTFRSSEQPQMLTPRNHHGLIKVGDGVLAIGGICKSIQVKCELFDLAGKVWTDVAPLNHERAAMGSCEIREQVYVFGGWDGHKEIGTIEKFSLRGGKWSLLPMVLPVASQCNAVVYDGRVLVFAFKPGKIYEVLEEKMEVFGQITNEAWCRPELRLYRDVVYSFRSGELKVLKYHLREGRFTVLSIEE